MKKVLLIGVGVIAIALILSALLITRQRKASIPSIISPTSRPEGDASVAPTAPTADFEVVASDLTIPWEIAFLPDGALLVTERPGRLVKIDDSKTVIPITGVAHVGEGGLLGLALHPNFKQNQLVYLYLTTKQGDGLLNRVERYRLDGTTLRDRTTILTDIPGASIHDGGRLAFGPDGLLYITTGDAGREALAQDTGSVAGKILRLHDDGRIPADNPFDNAVYSYGHRNPQGLAWDDQGNLWATEHGRSGVRSGLDEINLIEKGRNYGWPKIQGDESESGLTTPVIHSGSSTTWAPAGVVYHEGRLLFAGLRGEALYSALITDTEIDAVTPLLSERYGRLRAVAVGPDGSIYVSTSNRDGRGNVQAGDDKVIRFHPDKLNEN